MGLCRIQLASFKRYERQKCKIQRRGGSSGKVLSTKQAFVQHKTQTRVGGANTKEVTRAPSSETSAQDAEQPPARGQSHAKGRILQRCWGNAGSWAVEKNLPGGDDPSCSLIERGNARHQHHSPLIPAGNGMPGVHQARSLHVAAGPPAPRGLAGDMGRSVAHMPPLVTGRCFGHGNALARSAQ